MLGRAPFLGGRETAFFMTVTPAPHCRFPGVWFDYLSGNEADGSQ